MKRLLDADLVVFECDLLLDNLIEIAAQCDCVSQRLLRNTCKTLHKSLTLLRPLDLASDAFLHSLAQAHYSIIEEAASVLCPAWVSHIFPRFVYFLGLERGQHELKQLYPWFPHLDVFVQGRFFTGSVRRIGFKASCHTAVFLISLHACFEFYGEVDDILDNTRYQPTIVAFVQETLKAIIEEPERNVFDIAEHIIVFLTQTGAITERDPAIYTRSDYMFGLGVQALVQVLATYATGEAIASAFAPSKWKEDVVKYLKDEIEYLKEADNT